MQFMSYPDLNKMEKDEVLEFLLGEDITGGLAQKIVASENRVAAYANARRNQLISEAGRLIYNGFVLLQKQSVFIPAELAEQFDAALKQVSEARVEQIIARTSGGGFKLDQSNALVGEEGTNMFDEIRQAVRERLLQALWRPGLM
jgi:phosphoribosyl-ATP pyrophosphohydrolase